MIARRFVGEGDADPTLTVDPAYLRIVEKLAADEGLGDFARTQGLARLTIDEGDGPQTRWEPEAATVTFGFQRGGLMGERLSRLAGVVSAVAERPWGKLAQD